MQSMSWYSRDHRSGWNDHSSGPLSWTEHWLSEDAHIQTPGAREYVMLHGKGELSVQTELRLLVI